MADSPDIAKAGPQPTGADTVAAERAAAPRAAAMALAAGILPVVGTVLQSPLSNPPKSFLGNILYYSDHSMQMIFGSVLRGVGLLALAGPIVFLLTAAVARSARVPRFAIGLSIIGGIAALIGTVALGVISVSVADDLRSSTGVTYDQAKNLLKGPGIMAGSAAGLLGTLALAFGLVMASLNAMRVGLLTRFMGYIGIFAGVLLVIPIFSPVPVIQLFWLAALAALLLGRWPNGVPPAWLDGEAHPWPSAAQARAAAKADGASAQVESNGKRG